MTSSLKHKHAIAGKAHTFSIPCSTCGRATKHHAITSTLEQRDTGLYACKWGYCLTCGTENTEVRPVRMARKVVMALA